MSESGRLRHWLRFETLVQDQDSDGALTPTWVDAFITNPRMPCEVESLSGHELIAAQQEHSRVTTRIYARYRAGFDAVQRAVMPDGTIFNIEAVLPDTQSRIRSVTMLAYSGTNAGGTAT